MEAAHACVASGAGLPTCYAPVEKRLCFRSKDIGKRYNVCVLASPPTCSDNPFRVCEWIVVHGRLPLRVTIISFGEFRDRKNAQRSNPCCERLRRIVKFGAPRETEIDVDGYDLCDNGTGKFYREYIVNCLRAYVRASEGRCLIMNRRNATV